MKQQQIVNVQVGGCYRHHHHGRSGLVLLAALAWIVAEYWILVVTGLAVLVALALRMGRPEDITLTELPWNLWAVDLRDPKGGESR